MSRSHPFIDTTVVTLYISLCVRWLMPNIQQLEDVLIELMFNDCADDRRLCTHIIRSDATKSLLE